MGQIRYFFISDFSTFCSIEPNEPKSDLKKSRTCPIWGLSDRGQSDPLWSQTYHPCTGILAKKIVKIETLWLLEITFDGKVISILAYFASIYANLQTLVLKLGVCYERRDLN